MGKLLNTSKVQFQCIALFSALMFSINQLASQEQLRLHPNKRLNQFILRNWDTEKGMPSDVSVNIIQSSLGYLWIATYNGIARFDGQRFSSFDHKVGTNLDLSNQIQGLAEDDAGNIWFATLQGIVGYNNNKFFRSPALNNLNNKLVETLYFDKHSKRLWIGTNANGIYSFDGEQLTHYPEYFALSKAVVSSIQSDEQNNIWIGTEGGDIIRYSNRVFERIGSSNLLGSVASFYTNSSGRVWIATGNGVYTYELGKLNRFAEIPVTKVTEVLEDTNGFLWVGSQNGLYRYNIKQKCLDSLTEENGFPSNIIRNIIVDRQGSLWIATYRKGIVQLTDGPVYNVSTDQGLSSNIITGLAQYGASSYLIGHEIGKIDLFENNTIRPFNTKIPIPKDRLKHLMVDSHKTLWISTYSGLLRKDKDGREVFFNFKNGFPSESIRLTFEDNNGNIWVGTRSDGLFRMNRDGTIFQTYNQRNGFGSNYIMAIVQDKMGRIVVSTKNGIHIIENNKVSKVLSTNEGVPSSFSFNIHIDSNNVFWVASNDGLIRIEKDSLIFVYNSHNGLFDNSIYDVLEDGFGNLWLPSAFGIIKLKKQEIENFAIDTSGFYSQRVYDRSDGMKSNNCVGATKSMVAQNGQVLFTTSGGVAIIDPKTIEDADGFESVIFESMFGDATEYIPTSKGFNLSQGHKRFQIYFTTLNFVNPEKVQFRYKLEPFDNDWILAASERSASYTNLSPGNYNFIVRLLNKDGQWSTESYSVAISIEPNWYQTNWFIIFFSLAIASIIWLFFKIRTHTIKVQKDNLEKMVRERTALIFEQKQELERQAFELEKLSIVASHTNNAILIADGEGKIQWVNEAFTSLYQYTLDEFIGLKGETIIKASANDDIAYVIRNCIETKEPDSYTVQVVKKGGEKTWIQTTLTPILNPSGSIRNIVAIDTDITLLKDAEAEMVSMGEEILTQTEAISKQRDELEQLNNLLIIQKDNVEASIRYAKTIQSAVLPDPKTLNVFFDSFVVFKPRDIVSGDFYWFYKLEAESANASKFFLAVVDCTGHGVPGAFMSMIGSRLLTEIVTEHKTHSPSTVLTQLSATITKALRQDVSESFDGMDVALCQIEFETPSDVKLIFSGANRPIHILKRGSTNFETIRGSRKMIGGIMPDIDPVFAEHTILLHSGDLFVLNTDGFIDQNGLDKAKFSSARMFNTIVENIEKPLSQVGQLLDNAFEEYKSSQPQRDDATVIGIRIR